MRAPICWSPPWEPDKKRLIFSPVASETSLPVVPVPQSSWRLKYAAISNTELHHQFFFCVMRNQCNIHTLDPPRFNFLNCVKGFSKIYSGRRAEPAPLPVWPPTVPGPSPLFPAGAPARSPWLPPMQNPAELLQSSGFLPYQWPHQILKNILPYKLRAGKTVHHQPGFAQCRAAPGPARLAAVAQANRVRVDTTSALDAVALSKPRPKPQGDPISTWS